VDERGRVSEVSIELIKILLLERNTRSVLTWKTIGTFPGVVKHIDGHHIALHVFEWNTRYEDAGLARNAAYLLHPVTYVAVAETSASVTKLEEYFNSQEFVSTGFHFPQLRY
jgi:hypothetical protein